MTTHRSHQNLPFQLLVHVWSNVTHLGNIQLQSIGIRNRDQNRDQSKIAIGDHYLLGYADTLKVHLTPWVWVRYRGIPKLTLLHRWADAQLWLIQGNKSCGMLVCHWNWSRLFIIHIVIPIPARKGFRVGQHNMESTTVSLVNYIKLESIWVQPLRIAADPEWLSSWPVHTAAYHKLATSILQ